MRRDRSQSLSLRLASIYFHLLQDRNDDVGSLTILTVCVIDLL